MYVSITGEKKCVASKANNKILFEAQTSQVVIYVLKAFAANLHAHHFCIDTQKANIESPQQSNQHSFRYYYDRISVSKCARFIIRTERFSTRRKIHRFGEIKLCTLFVLHIQKMAETGIIFPRCMFVVREYQIWT